jgi:chromosome segregation ATPase
MTETAEIRIELAELRDVVHDGFARMDRYFELQQKQYLDLRAELRGDIQDLRGDVQALTRRVDGVENRMAGMEDRMSGLEDRMSGLDKRLGGLEHEVRALRDWATREITDVRLELRRLGEAVLEGAKVRKDVAALDERVTRLEVRLAKG